MPKKIYKESEKGLIVDSSRKDEQGVQAHTVYSETEKVQLVVDIYQEALDDIDEFNCGRSIQKPGIDHIQEFAKKIVKESKIL